MSSRMSDTTAAGKRLTKVRRSRFTDGQIARIAPREMRFIIWGERGLGLRVTPNGTKTWIYSYRFGGKARFHNLGFCPPMTADEAREAHLRAVGLRRQGIDPAVAAKAARETEQEAAREAERTGLTILELVEGPPEKKGPAGFLDLYARARTRIRTATETERILRVEVFPHWGDRKAREIRRKDVIELLDRITARGTPVMAGRTLAAVRKLFNWAADRELIPASPVERIENPDVRHKRDRALIPDEIERFLRGLQKAGPERIGTAVRLAMLFQLATAARPGEAAGLPWAEVDENEALWRLPPERSKNGRAHAIPLSRLALSILAEARDGLPAGRWAFPASRGEGPTNVSALNQAIRRNLEAWGFAGAPFVAHDIRRTAATGLASLWTQPAVIERILGHLPPRLVQTYQVYAYEKETRDALDRWGERLGQFMNEGPQ